jgi:hypothetical protein
LPALEAVAVNATVVEPDALSWIGCVRAPPLRADAVNVSDDGFAEMVEAGRLTVAVTRIDAAT